MKEDRHFNIQQLNVDFGIKDQVKFVEGRGGLPFIQITTEKATAVISIYAGQVLSFRPNKESEDVMFISDNAFFQEGKAIKGGIPICWPWFGGAPIKPENPSHGFVRNDFWTVSAVDVLKNGDVRVQLEFFDSDKTREMWPYQFHLSLDITIGDSLTLDLVTQNRGEQVFTITEALHAYFKVGDAAQVQVLGLEKTEYLDKAEDFIKVCQVGAVILEQETDHIHINVGHDLTILDPVLKRKIQILSSGNKNVVVWNPGAKGAEKMQDLTGEDYKRFICVEIANAASNKVTIQPDCKYRMVTNYQVVRD